MLQSFSDRIRNSRWLGYGIVIAISIPFALWGVEAYMGGAGPEVAAEVNGATIETYAVQQQVSQRRAQLRQRFGGELPDMFSEAMLREQVLDQLITREVLRQTADEAGLRIGADRLAARIRQQEYFQQDGRFDRDLYRRTLSQAGLSPAQYEAQMRQTFRVEQLRQGISGTAFALPEEARGAARLRRQERQVDVLEYPRARAAEEVSVTGEDVRAYYDAHRDQFQTPPRVRVAFLELDLQALADEVDLTEEELRAEYRANQQRYEQQAERQAAHILVEVPGNAGEDQVRAAREEARRLREQLAGGADFAALARQHSDDPGSASQGGDLGYIGRGTMVEPFEQALFGLNDVGAVSEPVRTQYGFHLIKLRDVRQTDARSFAEARDEIEQRMRMRRAERLFRDRVDVLQNTVYEHPGSLAPAAEATGLEIQRSNWFSRREGGGIAESEAIRQAAFQGDVREQGVNSGLIELGNRRVAALRVIDERPAQVKPLDAVRGEVRERVRQQRIDEVLGQWSESVVARLEDGAAPAELADARAQHRGLGWIRRDGDTDPTIARAAFGLSPPTGGNPSHEAVTLESGARAVVVVQAMRLPQVDDATVEQTRGQRRQGFARAEMAAWSAALRAVAEIERNEAARAQ